MRLSPATGMTLPAGHARHLVDRCPLGLTQHGNYHILLGGALRVGLRLALSGAACSSSFEATAISPSLTVAGALRHSVIPSLPTI